MAEHDASTPIFSRLRFTPPRAISATGIMASTAVRTATRREIGAAFHPARPRTSTASPCAALGLGFYIAEIAVATHASEPTLGNRQHLPAKLPQAAVGVTRHPRRRRHPRWALRVQPVPLQHQGLAAVRWRARWSQCRMRSDFGPREWCTTLRGRARAFEMVEERRLFAGRRQRYLVEGHAAGVGNRHGRSPLPRPPYPRWAVLTSTSAHAEGNYYVLEW